MEITHLLSNQTSHQPYGSEKYPKTAKNEIKLPPLRDTLKDVLVTEPSYHHSPVYPPQYHPASTPSPSSTSSYGFHHSPSGQLPVILQSQPQQQHQQGFYTHYPPAYPDAAGSQHSNNTTFIHRTEEQFIYDANNQYPSRKRRQNLPKATTDILLNWLKQNLDRPYPNSQEKTELVHKTGLTFQQLDNWFINARRRKVKNLKEMRSRNVDISKCL